uniref:Uncharacterized protein n=1 Tax=Timema poppense TaxID=170557 RepID=A0A7R9CQP7_TIMPO|nr:unnamed protein product [Timema poppensis]
MLHGRSRPTRPKHLVLQKELVLADDHVSSQYICKQLMAAVSFSSQRKRARLKSDVGTVIRKKQGNARSAMLDATCHVHCSERFHSR